MKSAAMRIGLGAGALLVASVLVLLRADPDAALTRITAKLVRLGTWRGPYGVTTCYALPGIFIPKELPIEADLVRAGYVRDPVGMTPTADWFRKGSTNVCVEDGSIISGPGGTAGIHRELLSGDDWTAVVVSKGPDLQQQMINLVNPPHPMIGIRVTPKPVPTGTAAAKSR
jgi:hypothetical protein